MPFSNTIFSLFCLRLNSLPTLSTYSSHAFCKVFCEYVNFSGDLVISIFEPSRLLYWVFTFSGVASLIRKHTQNNSLRMNTFEPNLDWHQSLTWHKCENIFPYLRWSWSGETETPNLRNVLGKKTISLIENRNQCHIMSFVSTRNTELRSNTQFIHADGTGRAKQRAIWQRGTDGTVEYSLNRNEHKSSPNCF